MEQQAQVSFCDMKLKGLLETLEIEFKGILADSHVFNKKKYPVLKDALDIAINWIRENKNKDFPQVDGNLTHINSVFEKITDARLTKMYPQMLNTIQRLVMTLPTPYSQAQGFKPSDQCRERLLHIFCLVTQPDQTSKGQSSSDLDEMTQIKVLQILMMFLDPQQPNFSKEALNAVLRTCFQMFETKVMKSSTQGASGGSNQSGSSTAQSGNYSMIKSTLYACLGQLLTLIVEIFKRETTSIIGQDLVSGPLTAEKILKILTTNKEKQLEIQNSKIICAMEDFCSNLATAIFIHKESSLNTSSSKKQTQSSLQGMMGAISNQHVWNFKPSISTKCCLLDLVNSLVSQTGSFLLFFPQMSKVFENQIIPSLSVMLKNIEETQGFDTVLGIKIIKSLCTVCKNLAFHHVVDRDDASANSSLDYSSQPEEGSSGSSKRQLRTSNRTIRVKDLNIMLISLANMADLEPLASSKGKDKEITTANINSFFGKMTWKHLISLEALCIFLSNRFLIHQLTQDNQDSALQFSLEILSKNMNCVLLLDLKNAQNMINNNIEDQLNLASISGCKPPGLNSSAKINENMTLDQLVRVQKVIEDSQLGGNEEDNLKSNVNPCQVARLTHECIFGLARTIHIINCSSEFQAFQAKPNMSTKESSKDSQERKGALASQNLAVNLSHLLIILFDKIYLDIQCNFAQDQTVWFSIKSKNSEVEELRPSPYTSTLSRQVFSFDSYICFYHVFQKSILSCYSLMIEVFNKLQSQEHRDIFLKGLCSHCVTKEVDLPKKEQQTPVFQSGKAHLSQGSLMACQAMIEIVSDLFDEKENEDLQGPAKKMHKMNSQVLNHEQDLTMWQHILEAILRIDSVLTASQEEEWIVLKQNSNNQEETSHLVDFAKIQRDVQKASPSESGLDQPKPTLSLSKEAFEPVWCFSEPNLPGQRLMQTLEINHPKLFKIQDKIILPYTQILARSEDAFKIKSQLSKIFSKSQLASKLTLFQFCGAYQRLLCELVSNQMKINTNESVLKGQSMVIQLLRRLSELVFTNIFRLEVVWDQFVAIINTLFQTQGSSRQNKSIILIRLAVEANQSVVLSYFNFKKSQAQMKKSLQPFEQEFKQKIIQTRGDLSSPDKIGSASDVEVDGEANISPPSSPEKEETMMNDIDDVIMWQGTKWQSTILRPLSEIMKSSSVNEKLLGLKSVERIIQLCGQNMKSEAWDAIISKVGRASASVMITSFGKLSQSQTQEIQRQEQQVYQNGFKCLKIIINNYIQELGQENFIEMFNCIQMYAQSNTDNINSNLIAIGMFMNVADYVANLTKQLNPEAEKQRNSDISVRKTSIDIKKIWSSMFDKMQQVAKENKAEIRRSIIQIFENIIINHGSIFPEEVWQSLFEHTLLNMIRYTAEIFNNRRSSMVIDPEEEKNDRKVMAFEDEKVLAALKDHDFQSRSETCIMIVSMIYRAIRKFILRPQTSDKSCLDNLWQSFHEVICSLIRHDQEQEDPSFNKTIVQIIQSLFKSIEDFLSDEDLKCLSFSIEKIEPLIAVLTQTQNWILTEAQNFDMLRIQKIKSATRSNSLIMKVVPDILSCLSKLFSPQAYKILLEDQEKSVMVRNFLQPCYVKQALSFIQSLATGCSQLGAAYHQQGTPYKLINEENQIFKLLEELSDVFSLNQDTLQLYIDYLLKDIKKFKGHSQDEAVILRSLEIVSSIVLSGVVDIESCVLDTIISQLVSLLDQQYQPSVCFSTIQNSHDSVHLIAGFHLINVIQYMVGPGEFKNSVIKQGQFQHDTQDNSMNDHEFQKMQLLIHQLKVSNGSVLNNPNRIKDSSTLAFSEKFWTTALELIRNHLLYDFSKLEKMLEQVDHRSQKELLPDLIIQGQTLEMCVMNLVVGTLLPALQKYQDEPKTQVIYKDLIELVDNGCQNYINGEQTKNMDLQKILKETYQSGDSNLSQFCLFNLFEICQIGRADGSKGSLSDETFVILMARCKQILKNFSRDEQRSGSIKLPPGRVREVILVLKEIKNLPKLVNESRASDFLVDLMPILTDLITTNRPEIKEHLKSLFELISIEVVKMRNALAGQNQDGAEEDKTQ